MADVLRAVEQKEHQRRSRLGRGIIVGSGAFSIAFISLLAVVLSEMLPPTSSMDVGAQGQGMAATVLAEGGQLGYVIMGLVGMVIGVAFAFLVVRFSNRTFSPEGATRIDGGERPW